MTRGTRTAGRRIGHGVVVAIIAVHAGIHLLGAAKGLRWAAVAQLTTPIGPGLGVAWLGAALLVAAGAVQLARHARGWWTVVLAGALVSQALVFTQWPAAAAGTGANAVMLAAAGYGWAAHGRRSLRAEYLRRAVQPTAPVAVVTESDAAALPAPVADYVRQSGAVGRPRVASFEAHIRGRIRSGPDQPWMAFTGRQVNTYTPGADRFFFLDATMRGLPVDVLHVFADDAASMRVRLCSLLPIVTATGPELQRAETVTVFNDLCVLAPAALVDAGIAWTVLGPRRVRGAFRRGWQVVQAELTFDDDGRLVDFVSDDRLRAAANGQTFTRQRWSTPLTDYRSVEGRVLPMRGEGRWHAPAPEGEFCYLEFEVVAIGYNGAAPATGRPAATVGVPAGR